MDNLRNSNSTNRLKIYAEAIKEEYTHYQTGLAREHFLLLLAKHYGVSVEDIRALVKDA